MHEASKQRKEHQPNKQPSRASRSITAQIEE